MNGIFGVFICISTILILASNPSLFLLALGEGGKKAFALSASLVGIYAFWMGVIKVLEKTPALSRFEKLLSPVVSRIFPSEPKEVRKLITMNISANMLGVGGAATPLGISAIEMMAKNARMENPKGKGEKATKSMLILFILNATSLQIIPTTVISLRESAGSVAPASVLMPTLIASTIATVLGVVLVWILEK